MDDLVKALAIIPARGGSKRIPRKNIVDLGGRPLIEWTIDAALGSQCFERVVVSTDDDEIANVGLAAGAEVPFLRDRNADDHASASAATLRGLEQTEEAFNENYEIVCQLMVTTPLRTAIDIQKAIKAFRTGGSPAQISCVAFEWLNPWWAVTIDEEGRPTPLFPNKRMARSQDLPALYAPTGAIWLAKTKTLKEEGTFYASNHRFFPIDSRNGIDIDSREDLELVRAIVTSQRGYET